MNNKRNNKISNKIFKDFSIILRQINFVLL